jgi:ubiquinone biosynthesis protein
MGIAFRHRVRLPADLALLARTVVVLEGVVRELDPAIVLADHLEPFIMRLLRERTSLRRLGLDAAKGLADLREMLHVLPGRVDSITGDLSRGQLTLGLELRRMDVLLRRFEAVGNRISFSVVVAALIVGSALILLGGESAAIFRLPFTDIILPVPQIGFLVAGLLGAWWLFSIIRSKGL